MASITLKDLPDKLHRQLKARALQQHRSLNGHIIALLEAATAPQKIDLEALLTRASKLRSRVAGRLTDAELTVLRNTGRR